MSARPRLPGSSVQMMCGGQNQESNWAVMNTTRDQGDPALSLDTVRGLGLDPIQRQVAISFVDILSSLPPGCASATWRCNPPIVHLAVAPSHPAAASIEVYLDTTKTDPDEIGSIIVGSGEDVCIDCVDLLYDHPNLRVVSYFEAVVRAIVAGRLEETLYYGGRVLYRSKFVLSIADTKAVALNRTNVPAWFFSLGRPRSCRKLSYKAYSESEGKREKGGKRGDSHLFRT